MKITAITRWNFIYHIVSNEPIDIDKAILNFESNKDEPFIAPPWQTCYMDVPHIRRYDTDTSITHIKPINY